MNFAIFEGGNLVASYDDEPAAVAAYFRIAEAAAGAADGLVLVAFDQDEAVAILRPEREVGNG